MQDPWQAAMREGDFARAWAISDAHLRQRLARGEPQQGLPRHLQSVWDGTPLANKHVLIRCYHGLGDTVQFIRFARPLRRIASEVSVWCQPALMNLISTVEGVNRVLALHDGAPAITYDADIEVMELAHALRISPEDLPGPVPYIHPARSRSPSVTDGALKVGLVWEAGDWERRRSIELSLLEPLLQLEQLQIHSLQRGPARAQLAGCEITDSSTDDVDALAAKLLSLDLLITVDTFVAHLAGALGVRTFLLLHSECDWRWMRKTQRTVWYPQTRLFRQRRPGDWGGVVIRLLNALRHDCFTVPQSTEILLRKRSNF